MDGDWDTLFWATQIFGALAVIIQNAATFLPCGRRIMKVQFISTMCWVVYYTLLGMYNVSVICLAAALRIVVSVRASDKFLKTYSFLHTSVLCLVLGYMAAEMHECFPILIALVSHYRVLARDQLPKFLYISLIMALMWGGYSLYCGAWFGLLNDSIALLCASTALYRFYATEKKKSVVAVPA